VLHRVSNGTQTLYWVGDYPIYLLRSQTGWKVCAPPSRIEVKQWLLDIGLTKQCFSTRKEALQVLLFALDQSGSPQPDNTPSFSRTSDGGYKTAKGAALYYNGSSWDIYTPDDKHHSNVRGSLWRALWVADSLALQPDTDNPWSKALRYDRHQRDIAEGKDRPLEFEQL